jgi:replicative DNA helicase
MSSTHGKPPYDLDAEKSVISSILIDRDALIKAAEMIQKIDFYDPVHQTIYDCCIQLFEQSSAVDIVTVKSFLSKNNLLQQAGGEQYLYDLLAILPLTTNIEYYSKIIKEASLRRRIIGISADLVGMGMDETKKIDEIIDEVEKRIFSISSKSTNKGFVHIKNVIMENTERYEELQKNPGGIRGIPTGFEGLNNMLGGFHKGDLVIIAARPSVGKTAFMLDIARHMGVHEKKKVAVFSLEMGRDQLADRLIAMEGDVALMNIRMGNLYGEEEARYHEAMGLLYDADIFIDDTPGQHITELRTKCRRMDLEVGLDVIFVDYLQLLHASRGKENNRALEVSEISKSLKNIGRELQVPVVALSQLNRSVESRNDRRPQLSDLRESGSIEQDADIVMFLHREAMYNRDMDEAEKDKAEIIIAKHRNGATGMLNLKFVGEQARYRDGDNSEQHHH